MNTGLYLDEQTLGRAAFDLLASNTIGHYARAAHAHASRTGLAQRVASEPEAARQLVERARRLWQIVSSRSERDLDEAELAVIIAALDQPAPDADALALVRRIAASDAPSGWIPALARRYLARRRPHRELRDVSPSGEGRRGHLVLQERPCT